MVTTRLQPWPKSTRAMGGNTHLLFHLHIEFYIKAQDPLNNFWPGQWPPIDCMISFATKSRVPGQTAPATFHCSVSHLPAAFSPLAGYFWWPTQDPFSPPKKNLQQFVCFLFFIFFLLSFFADLQPSGASRATTSLSDFGYLTYFHSIAMPYNLTFPPSQPLQAT